MKRQIFSLSGLVAGFVFITGATGAEPSLHPWPENPWYWSHRGEPVLLLGGSNRRTVNGWPNQAAANRFSICNHIRHVPREVETAQLDEVVIKSHVGGLVKSFEPKSGAEVTGNSVSCAIPKSALR